LGAWFGGLVLGFGFELATDWPPSSIAEFSLVQTPHVNGHRCNNKKARTEVLALPSTEGWDVTPISAIAATGLG